MQLRRALCIWGMAVMLLIASGLSSCGPGGSQDEVKAPTTVAPPPEPVEPKVAVVYTTTKIAKNRFVRPYWLEVREIPESQAPTEEGFFSRIDEVVGMRVIEDLEQEAPVLKKSVEDSTIERLSALVTKGMVAIALPTSAVTANPFLAQNDRVDILATLPLTDEEGKTRQETQVIARNIRVLAVHRTFDPGTYAKKPAPGEEGNNRDRKARNENIRNPYQGREEIRSVVVEASPGMARRLGLAMEMTSKLRLATVGATGTTLKTRDVRVDDSWLAAARKLGLNVGEEEVETTIPREVSVHRANGRQFIKKWSKKVLTAPYDEDGDAPLEQDGKPTGVVDRRRHTVRPAAEQDLLEPLDEVDDSEISLPSLPEGIALPELPE